MNQINHAFGQTLEFSCTINDGKITAQELVTSGPDVIVTVRMDQGHYLEPDDLEGLAGEMRAYLSEGKYSRVASDEADIYMAAAKDFLLSHPVLKDADPGVAYALAEYMAYKEYKTMYDAAVTNEPEPIFSMVRIDDPANSWDGLDDEDDPYGDGDFDDDEDDYYGEDDDDNEEDEDPNDCSEDFQECCEGESDDDEDEPISPPKLWTPEY